MIGGGIIGLCSAFYLQKKGWNVTVLDKTDLSDNCSYGNLGMIVPSHFVPLAAPGIVSQGIKWMFNDKSPFYIKPSLNHELITWGYKFIRSATRQKAENAAQTLLNLNLYSKALYDELSKEDKFDFAYEKKGILMYYQTRKTADEENHLVKKAKAMGLDAEVLGKREVQALEPSIEMNVLGAAHYHSDAHLHPNKLIPQLVAALKTGGAVIHRNSPVTKFVIADRAVKKVVSNNSEYGADIVVLAGGSGLPSIAKLAGIKVPLMPGKGYSITYNNPANQFNIPAILCEARVAITPMSGSMRYGGTMEIGAINNKVNFRRVEGILESVERYFPGLKLERPAEKDVWYGFRPCSPDGLPYIGYTRSLNNVIVAGGHAMMGLSLGPATGSIVADLAGGQQPVVDISLLEVERFS